MKTYARKTKDEWQLWTNYGYGWECECVEESRDEGRLRRKEYLENAQGLKNIKLVKRRVPL